MRTRAELGCGALRIVSAPGGGTTVEAWLPLASRPVPVSETA
jgi:signal transduction histidine kinase